MNKFLRRYPFEIGLGAIALDALVEAFDAVGEWEMPQIAPASSPMGCLPIS